jgi:hypothetical protein
VVVLFFGSVQLLSLGIIGEYLRRIFLEVKGRPTFLIREVVSSQSFETQPPIPKSGMYLAETKNA